MELLLEQFLDTRASSRARLESGEAKRAPFSISSGYRKCFRGDLVQNAGAESRAVACSRADGLRRSAGDVFGISLRSTSIRSKNVDTHDGGEGFGKHDSSISNWL